jgi:hypothetical protein
MRKVLVIAYYWPPAGGPGVQRWLKFVKYLPEYGIQPVVYVPEQAAYPIIDEDLMKQVPQGITVISRPIKEPSQIFGGFLKKSVRSISAGIIPEKASQSVWQRFMIWIRGNLFIPDARIFWVKPSVSYLKSYIRAHQIDMVITTGPPHSVHLIGLRLKEDLKIKWLADFRDPWTTISYHKALFLSAWAKKQHNILEAKVLQLADQIIVTSKSTRDEFLHKTNQPIAVITNGYDVATAQHVMLDKKFTIAHIGSLLSGRNPLVLWQVLCEMITEEPSFKDSFELHLAGAVSTEVKKSIKNYKLESYCVFHGYMTHDQAVNLQQKAQVLLLIEIDSADTKCILPGKLFEYMVSGRPVLGIGPAGSDIEQIMQETEIGVYTDYAQKEVIKNTLTNWFRKYQAGKLFLNAKNTDFYSRKNLTGILANVIKSHWV